MYAIPLFHQSNKPAELLLGHWSVQGLVEHQSGFALSPGISLSTGGLAARPNVVGRNRKVGKLSEWFDTTAFQAPTFGFYGDEEMNHSRARLYISECICI